MAILVFSQGFSVILHHSPAPSLWISLSLCVVFGSETHYDFTYEKHTNNYFSHSLALAHCLYISNQKNKSLVTSFEMKWVHHASNICATVTWQNLPDIATQILTGSVRVPPFVGQQLDLPGLFRQLQWESEGRATSLLLFLAQPTGLLKQWCLCTCVHYHVWCVYMCL